jgi:prepilin-type processing-associated H-X9-DG protein
MDNGLPFADPQTGQTRGVSYVVPVLPYLDRADLEKAWKTPAAPTGKDGNAQSRHPPAPKTPKELGIVVCPSRPLGRPARAPLSYVVNCGMADWPGKPARGRDPGIPRDWPENGVFFDLFTGNPVLAAQPGKDPQAARAALKNLPVTKGIKYPKSGLPLVWMSTDFISRADGVGQTCMFSENVDAGQYTDDTEAQTGIVWNGSGHVGFSGEVPHLDPPSDDMRINVGIGKSKALAGGVPSDTRFARPSSLHPGGVNMAFCDGKVGFVSESMDYYVYCTLMSTNGSRVRLPGSTKTLQDFARGAKERWYME